MIIGITGSRSYVQSYREKILETMYDLVGNIVIKQIIFGGALGVDTDALSYALAHRRFLQRTGIKFTVILPCTIKEQPESTWDTTRLADEVIELGDKISFSDGFRAFKVRNQAIVDRSDSVYAFWNGQYQSGTYSCMRYALSKQKLHTTIALYLLK